MRILVAGGTGAIGRRLVPLLQSDDHQITVLARHAPDGTAPDVQYVQADALDAAAVQRAFATARPDAVVNVLTAIPDPIDAKHMARQFGPTNALRTRGTRNLADAAQATGAKLVSESVAFGYDPAGDGPADEDDALWQAPPKQFAPVLAAIRDLERATLAVGGAVLRMGHLHGPGTSFGPGGGFERLVRAGKVPVVGGGTARFSFLHVDDAAGAIAAALAGPAGVYNIVDDEPVAVSEWLPAYAARLGVRKPRSLPAFVVRLAVGGWGVAYLTALRAASNVRAAQRLGWHPTQSWRTDLQSSIAPGGAARR